MKRRILQALGILMLVVLPLAIAGAAALLAYRRSPVPQERNRATVIVKPPSTIQNSASAVNLFIADVGEQIEADPMAAFVISQVTELDDASYRRGIDAARRGTTSLIELSFTHADASIAETAVDVVARRLLDEAARGEFERTQFLLGRATERLDAAQDAVDEYFRTHEVFDPDFEYRNALDQVANLNQQITTGQALQYGETYLAELEAERDEIERQIPRLGEAMLTFRQLSIELQLAQSAWQQATVNNDSAEFSYLTVDTAENLIASQTVTPFVDDTARWQTTALAGVVAFLLALLIVTPLSNRLRRGPKRGRHKINGDSGSNEGRTSDEMDLTIVMDSTDRPVAAIEASSRGR
jgi:hypothetical protein